MSSDFERELAEDWQEAADQLDSEGAIEIGVSDAVEFGEE